MPTKQKAKRKKIRSSPKTSAKKRAAGVSNTKRKARRVTGAAKSTGKQRKQTLPIPQSQTTLGPSPGTESSIRGKDFIVSATKIAIGTRRRARALIEGAKAFASGIPAKVKGLRHRKKSS